MKRALLLLKDHPEMGEFIGRLDEVTKQTAERAAFLQKQINAEKERHKKSSDDIWMEIEASLKSKGVIPEDYTKEKNSLQIDQDAGVLYLMDPEDCECMKCVQERMDIPAMVKKFFAYKGNPPIREDSDGNK